MIKLREFGAARGNFHQGAARACSGASQHFYEHPWGTESHAAAKLLLPGTIGHLFCDDVLAYRHDLVDDAAMQAFAVRGESALAGRFAPPGDQIPLARLPLQVRLPAFLDAPALMSMAKERG